MEEWKDEGISWNKPQISGMAICWGASCFQGADNLPEKKNALPQMGSAEEGWECYHYANVGCLEAPAWQYKVQSIKQIFGPFSKSLLQKHERRDEAFHHKRGQDARSLWEISQGRSPFCRLCRVTFPDCNAVAWVLRSCWKPSAPFFRWGFRAQSHFWTTLSHG